MAKRSIAIILICSLFVVVSGCAKSSHVLKKEPGEEVNRQTLTIRPGASAEECIELRPGMVFDYDFDASDIVDFNIHYHAEDEVKYPVLKKGIMYSKGSIDPGTHDYFTPDQEYYCLMWDNLNEKIIKVSFKCVLKNK